MRLAIRVLVLLALPGLVFGAVVRVSMPDEPDCGSGTDSGLLSLYLGHHAPCVPGDQRVVVAIVLIVAVAVIAGGVARYGVRLRA